MHRLGRHKNTLVSYGTRFSSATATSEPALPRNRRHGITLRWGTVIIPSRDEVLKMPKAQLYSPDLSYLEKAPQSSLAGRLAKPKFQPKDISAVTEKRRAQRLAREQKIAKLSTPDITSETKTPKVQPPNIAAITQRRIEERLAREAKKTDYINKTIRTVQDNTDKLSSLGSLFDSPGPLPLARSAGYPSPERSDDQLSPLALKRREERRLREKNTSRDRRSPTRRNRRAGSTESDDMEFGSVKPESFDSVESMLEAASPTVHGPEFNGPEPISEAMDVVSNNFRVVQPARQPFEHGQHSIRVAESFGYRPSPNLIDSFVGGDYSRYTSLSSTSNLTSPKGLAILKTAELALSHQRDYIIPQRKHAIRIVKTLIGGDSVQVVKERQTTA